MHHSARYWTLTALATLLLSARPPSGTPVAAQPDGADPSPELILLATGSVEGNLEPCG